MKQNKSTKMLAVQSLRLHQGYHSVTKGMINNWISRKDKNGDGTINLPRGRTVNHIFEAAVMNKLIICCLTEPVGDEMPRVEVVANAAFSYSLFIRAAAEVMEEDPFKNDPDLQTLTFSPKWVFNLIQRFKMSKKRCTTKMKVKPSPATVRARLTALQAISKEHKIPPERVFNADETAIHSCAEMLGQYCPADAERAVDPTEGAENRFTLLLGSSGKGKFLPAFIIVKVAPQDDYDLTGEQTLDKIKRENGWGDEWEKKIFTITLPSTDKTADSSPTTITYKRPYLINSNTLDVVTVQKKAWNDRVGLIMHARLQLKRVTERAGYLRNELCLYVVDNVGFHHGAEVKQAFLEAGFILEYLPANMTDELQPMDLCVNSVFKAEMRRLRANVVYDALQDFRTKLLHYYAMKGRAKARGEEFSMGLPRFKPPKPTYKEAIQATLEVIQNKLSTPTFAATLEKTFQKVGLIESYASDNTPYYTTYVPRKSGSFGGKAPVDGENVQKEDIANMQENSLAAYLVDFIKKEDDVDDEYYEDETRPTKPKLTACSLIADSNIVADSPVDAATTTNIITVDTATATIASASMVAADNMDISSGMIIDAVEPPRRNNGIVVERALHTAAKKNTAALQTLPEFEPFTAVPPPIVPAVPTISTSKQRVPPKRKSVTTTQEEEQIPPVLSNHNTTTSDIAASSGKRQRTAASKAIQPSIFHGSSYQKSHDAASEQQKQNLKPMIN